jgi:hypothetical protein
LGGFIADPVNLFLTCDVHKQLGFKDLSQGVGSDDIQVLMNAKANDVACTLHDRFLRECRHLTEIRKEMKKHSDAYFRYCDLRVERERVSALIVKIHGVLGKFSPPVTPEMATEISPRPLVSDETRLDLKIWEVLELFLASIEGKASVREFQDFLSFMDLDATSQAIESAVKVHPELFETQMEGREKFLKLKTARGVQ